MKKSSIFSISICIFSLAFLLFFTAISSARTRTEKPSAILYEMKEGSKFDYWDETPVKQFSYGNSTAGNLSLTGNIVETTSYEGTPAYIIDGDVGISYDFDKKYAGTTKDGWYLSDIKTNTLIKYLTTDDKNVGKGFVAVTCYEDDYGQYCTAAEFDIFGNNNKKLSDFCKINREDFFDGRLYIVYIGYQMERKTGKQTILKKDKTEVIECLEVYHFYVYYNGSPIKLIDNNTRKDITSTTSSNGEVILDTSMCSAPVKVTKDEKSFEVWNNMTLYESGKYTFEYVSQLGKKYTSSFTVKKGSYACDIKGEQYIGDKTTAYDTKQMADKTGTDYYPQISSLQIISDDAISKEEKNSFGISGSNTKIVLKIDQYDKSNEYSFFERFSNSFVGFEEDNFGKKEDEKIADEKLGEMKYGALIIKKSKDGINWENTKLGTSDYLTTHTSIYDECIYTPDGEEIRNGLYIRVIFAYKFSYLDSTYRAMEEYTMYLGCDDLDAVVFHNLSAKSSLESKKSDMDECQYKAAVAGETMQSGDMTVTGFTIDTTNCPSAKYTISKNGREIVAPENNEIRESGFYHIVLTNNFGKMKQVNIYVDASSDEELLDKYFVSETLDLFDADNIAQRFLLGKRIYKEGNYPVFEAGELFCCLKPTPENCLPVTGYIKNTSKNTKLPVQISSGDEAVFIPIDDPGEYIAKLNVGTKEAQYVTSGDIREVTFKFTVIEKGTAPGPVLNKTNLVNDYASSTLADSYPLYYGITDSSAAKGYITRAYSTKESAYNAAYVYAKGNVEVQSDGTYKYNGSLNIKKKVTYKDGWELTDAINYFAEEAIELKDFDLSEESSYITLDEKITKEIKNLRTLELDESVIIYANDEEKRQLAITDTLPLISAKPQTIVTETSSANDVIEREKADFKFIHDKYGCDSNTVTITNEYGQTLNVRYNVGIGKQLSDAGFFSGIVTITETTFWNDSVSYQALYIADGDNQAKVTLTYYEDGAEKYLTIDQNSPEKHYYTDAFRISDIADELDKYSHISVSYMRNEDDVSLPATDVYDSEHLMSLNDTYITPGDYEVKVINRVGNAYTFIITVTENGGYLYLSFAGDGTEGMDKIFTKIGMQNVSLQNLSKYGYDFIGFKDSDGTLYKDSIGTVLFTQDTELTSAWSPKTVKVILKDPTGTIINTQEVHFGSDIELPALADTEEMQFAGWDRNGTVISGKMLIDTEEDIVLTASFSNKASSGSDGFVTFLTYFILCLPVLVVVAIIIVILVIVKKIKKHKKAK